MQYFITMFNHYILLLFIFIYKTFNIETLEDRFHKDKKDNKIMNTIKFDFNNKEEFEEIKGQLLKNIVNDTEFLNKYNITSESILNNSNNVFNINFKDNTIYILANHYYMGGTVIFQLLHKMFNSTPPKVLKTNPFLGLINLPFYFYDNMHLTKKSFINSDIKQTHYLNETNIITDNKTIINTINYKSNKTFAENYYGINCITFFWYII